jgi:hypothetical protein
MSAVEKDVAPEKEPTLRETLISARDEIEKRETEAPTREPSERVETAAEAADRVRDEKGRFASTREPAEPAAAAPQEVAAADVAPPAGPAVAPNAWPTDLRSEWANVPPKVKEFLHKREADVTRGFTVMDEERKYAKQMREAIQPYLPIIQMEGGTPHEAVQNLLNTAYILRTADPLTKAQALVAIGQRFNVDLSVLQGQQQQRIDPVVQSLQQQVQQLTGHLTQQQQLQQQREMDAASAQVAAFENDPKYPHFTAVRQDMAMLVGQGLARTLEEAYEKAIWSRSDLRQQLLAEQSAQQQKEAPARQAAQKARAKGVSVRGGPGNAALPARNPNSTVREDLEAAMGEVLSQRI